MDLLTYLNLGGNALDPSPLPDALQRLTALQELVLGDMGWTGMLPSWMAALPELVLLDLGSNAFEGTVPDRPFSAMKNLTFVQLSGNALEGEIPKVFGELPQLRVLTMGGNKFTAMEQGFCEGEGTLIGKKASIFSGDCDHLASFNCFTECCNEGACQDLFQLLHGQEDLQWNQGYGYWFAPQERMVYDIRPLIAANALTTKESYARYEKYDYYADDDDDDNDDDNDNDEADDFDELYDDNVGLDKDTRNYD
mmetsp:Transcript_33539/g.66282  ORF Transcript_33539/g.66282 Transcript_33539/m.66282 type:complete len:252 (-) Transcript_33539:140-895(-)